MRMRFCQILIFLLLISINLNANAARESASLLKTLGGLLGLLQQNPQDYLQNKSAANESNSLIQDGIEQLIQQRLSARKEGRYSDADSIRKRLLERGIILEDNSQGTTWRRQ